ncbi:unnamed protein product [Psylliodes chrysocephalus]|uniref:E3 ubiquitin-protein ligase n=1 Tax=Psylliodes chrysocephalus TaxID=3402493 RepID=A0A9P0D2X7_9CUCU|nr:unnamed protein product [Psylliodes chrysocephala]
MSQIENLIISDYVLNQQVCDYCHKYLSVTPVKVYPNRKIKCGRCSTINKKEEDIGVNSMYNKIAEISIFKCINMFDGCIQLLRSSEVVEHEKVCLSKKYGCPLCSEEIFSFLMIHHFKLKHPESLLKTNDFLVTNLKNTNKYFLYQLQCNLFFVNFRDVTNSIADDIISFSLNVQHLEKIDCINWIKVDFSHFGNDIETISEITYSGSMTFKTSVIVTNESKMLIKFYLNIVEAKNGIQHKFKLRSVPKNNPDLNIFHKKLAGNELRTAFFQKHYVSPNEIFQKSVSDLSITENATVTFSRCGKKYTITFACCNCSLIYSTIFINHEEFIYLIGDNFHYCLQCLHCENKLSKRFPKKFFTVTDMENILFFCIWGCGTLHNYNDLYVHERMCKNQIFQKCPIKSCFCYFKLYEFENHFKVKHSSVIFQSPRLNDRELTIYLDTSKSPIEHIALFWFICVLVQLEWEQPNWKISLTCEIPDVEIKAKILDTEDKEISTITESGSIPHHDSIEIALYLVDTKKN